MHNFARRDVDEIVLISFRNIYHLRRLFCMMNDAVDSTDIATITTVPL